ncbi:MAG TPA: peptidoglycan-binding protein, partial [Candidatus Saccharimonadia bacterium]|nr:peptidoglycan-binding protein [Candidatus Saccharimonadia bacterium]
VNHAADEAIGKNRRRRTRYVLAAALVAALGFTALWAAREPPVALAPPVVDDVPAPRGLSAAELATRVAALPEAAPLAAWTQLLALWQVDPQRLTVRDAAACPADIYAGLSCLRLSGNLAKLRALGRPVMLQLHVGDRHPLAVLRGLGETTARIDFGVPSPDDPTSAVVEIPLVVLDQVWLGEFYALWKSPEGLPETIRRGDVGAPAAWLRERLARFEAFAPIELVGPPMVDSQLEARVRTVQSRFGLSPDGIVGPETELALTSRDPDGPVLAREAP